MPTNSVKDEIFLMFERSVTPKLELEIRKAPHNLACVVSAGPRGITALETAKRNAEVWDAKIRIFSWVRYYNDLIHILEAAIAEEELLEQRIKNEFSFEDITPVMAPDPKTTQEQILELGKKEGRSVDLFLKLISEGVYDLLYIPVPLFARDYNDEHLKNTLGNEIEIILRKTSRTLPICLVPKKITGDDSTVVVLVRPEIIAPLTSRILQLFNKNTNVILVSVLDPKLIDLYQLMRSNEEDPDEFSREEIENQMKDKIRGFMEQIVTSIRGQVKSTKIEIISDASLGLATSNIVESNNAANVLVYSKSTEENLLDPEVDVIGRLVPQTRIFIVWN